MMESICETCNKPFTYPTTKRNRRFCSLECFGKSVKKTIIANCSNCGKPLEREKSWAKRVKHFFCDKDCHNQWQEKHYDRGKDSPKYKSIIINCTYCGKPLERPPYRVKNHKNAFCDNVCSGEWRSQNVAGESHPRWKNGHKGSYGPTWKAQKRKARKRDSYRCQNCHIHESALGQRLDVHHIKPFRLFGIERHKEANDLSNLISLCRHCHTQIEHGKLSLPIIQNKE